MLPPPTSPLRMPMRSLSGVSTTVLRKKSVMSAPAFAAWDRMADHARRFESAPRSILGLAQNWATDSTTRHALSGSRAARAPTVMTAPSMAALPWGRCPLGSNQLAMDTAKLSSIKVSLLDSAGRHASMGGNFKTATLVPCSGDAARR